MFYRGLKFPHRPMVFHALESDAANTSLNGQSGKKKYTVGFSMI
jgi:hypothetical protein